MLLKVLLLLLSTSLLLALVASVAATLIYLDSELWMAMTCLALLGVFVVIAQIGIFTVINERF